MKVGIFYCDRWYFQFWCRSKVSSAFAYIFQSTATFMALQFMLMWQWMLELLSETSCFSKYTTFRKLTSLQLWLIIDLDVWLIYDSLWSSLVIWSVCDVASRHACTNSLRPHGNNAYFKPCPTILRKWLDILPCNEFTYVIIPNMKSVDFLPRVHFSVFSCVL